MFRGNIGDQYNRYEENQFIFALVLYGRTNVYKNIEDKTVIIHEDDILI